MSVFSVCLRIHFAGSCQHLQRSRPQQKAPNLTLCELPAFFSLLTLFHVCVCVRAFAFQRVRCDSYTLTLPK